MKKIIATIFALATILALTIIPASATYSQYNVPLNPDSNGRMWVDVTNSSGNHILYVMIEMDPSDIPEGAEFDVTYTDRSNNFISGPVLDSLGEMLGLYINDSIQFEVTDSSNKTLIKDATFYVEAADRKNAYAINTVAFTQMSDELAAIVVKHKGSNEELIISSHLGGFKRIHFSDLEETSRNAKGSRLYKQVKSKPHFVKFAKTIKGTTGIMFKDDEGVPNVSDIPFMDLESTFSTPFKIKDDKYSFIKEDLSDFEEALIIDVPKGYFEETDKE